jgi:hypothetical protein
MEQTSTLALAGIQPGSAPFLQSAVDDIFVYLTSALSVTTVTSLRFNRCLDKLPLIQNETPDSVFYRSKGRSAKPCPLLGSRLSSIFAERYSRLQQLVSSAPE